MHCLQFESINDSHVAFAILNSRLVYWIWYILGDGFHITSRLFANIPFNKSLVPKDDYIELSHIGRVLWEKVREKPFISTNKGRINVGFNPLEHHSERDAIDNILVKFYNLNQDFAIELKQFARSKSINL